MNTIFYNVKPKTKVAILSFIKEEQQDVFFYFDQRKVRPSFVKKHPDVYKEMKNGAGFTYANWNLHILGGISKIEGNQITVLKKVWHPGIGNNPDRTEVFLSTEHPDGMKITFPVSLLKSIATRA